LGGRSPHDADDYASGAYRYWHASAPSPDLVAAVDEGWIRARSRVLDVGCGAGTEVGALAARGFLAFGIDLSPHALRLAAEAHGAGRWAVADALRLPFRDGAFDAAIDRGCFHYLAPADRPTFATELRRVLAPGGGFLMRASLRSHGLRNDVDEDGVRAAFDGWAIESMDRRRIPANERELDALVVRMRVGPADTLTA
jgi:SAM-dependent methyltransferase